MKKYEGALIELLENTTIHGLNHVYTAKIKTTKFLWLFLFLVGIGGFSFSVIFIIKRYISNPILVTHFIDNEKFVWPDLTFCNPTAPFDMNYNQTEFYYWQNISMGTKKSIKKLSESSELFTKLRSFHDDKIELAEMSVMMSTANPILLGTNRFESNFLFYGYSKFHPEIFLVQEYKRYPTDFVAENMKEDVKRLFSTQFVQFRNNIPCHTFRLENSKMINSSLVHSLFFFIKFNYLGYKIFNSSYIPRSVVLFITKNNILPQNDETLILPGFNNEIKISQVRFQHHEAKNPCRKAIFRVELYDSTLTSTSIYEGNHEDCRKVMSQKLYVNTCNCYSPFLPIYKDSTRLFPGLCFNASIFSELEIFNNAKCMYGVYENYSKNSTFKKTDFKECEQYKPMKCDDIYYKRESSKEMFIELSKDKINDRMNTWLQNSYEKLFKRPWKDQNYLKETKENIGLLVVRRTSQSGDLFVEEMEYSHSDLLSDIGGLMGLWLGLSVVGLFEIGEIAYLLSFRGLFYCFSKLHINRNSEHHEQSDVLNDNDL